MTIEHTLKIQNIMRMTQPEGWIMTKAEENDEGNVIVTLKLPAPKPGSEHSQEAPGK